MLYKPAPLRFVKLNQNHYKYWDGNAVCDNHDNDDNDDNLDNDDNDSSVSSLSEAFVCFLDLDFFYNYSCALQDIAMMTWVSCLGKPSSTKSDVFLHIV